MNTIPITGNTYPIKDQLRALGGRWDPDRKAWMVPSEKANQARALVTSASNSSGTPATSMPKKGGPWAGASGGVRHEKGRNRKSGYCESCGDFLTAGAGRLEYCVEDSGCPKHHDYAGYHLYCADTGACNGRRKERIAEAKAKKQAIAEAGAALNSLIEALPKVEVRPEWATDETLVAKWAKPAMVHTCAYPHLYQRGRDLYYRVPGYFACDWDYPEVMRAGTLGESTDISKTIDAARNAGILKTGTVSESEKRRIS